MVIVKKTPYTSIDMVTVKKTQYRSRYGDSKKKHPIHLDMVTL